LGSSILKNLPKVLQCIHEQSPNRPKSGYPDYGEVGSEKKQKTFIILLPPSMFMHSIRLARNKTLFLFLHKPFHPQQNNFSRVPKRNSSKTAHPK
jgi:hypothetical protein